MIMYILQEIHLSKGINMAQKPVQEDPRASGTSTSADNKRQPIIQEKKGALREIPDKTKSAETPVLSKDKVSTSDSSGNKIAGTKRMNPSSPASPLTYTYVRRRLDTEQGKANGSSVNKEDATKEKTVKKLQHSQESQNMHDSQHLQNIYNGEATEAVKPQNGSKPDVSKATKPQNGFHEAMSEATKPQNEKFSEQNGSKGEKREATKPQNGTKEEASEVTRLVSSSLTASQDWKERFIRLQAFLKSCDQSNQEDYMRST
jgi:hypothetical protein